MNDLKNQLPQEVEEYLEEEREEKMQSTDFGAFMRSINELEELLEEEEQEMSKERRFLEGRVHEIQTKLVKEMERSKQMMKLKNDYEQAIKELEEKLGKEQQARQELEKVLDEKIHQVEDLQYQISKREEEVQHALQSAEEESVSKASSMKQMREVQNQIKELQEDLEAERESRNTAEKQKRDISEVYIQAASGKGHAVTEVMLWEGPVDGIATFNHYRESDWTQEFCSCCFITPIPENCTACNCTKYLSDKFGNDNVTAPPTMSTTTMVQTTTQPYEIVQTVKTNEKDIVYNITNPGNTTVTDQEPVDTSTSPAQPSCGIQVVADTSPYLVSWCRLYNDSLTPLYTDDDLDFDPSAGFHDYKMVVDYEKYDQIEKTWCLKVYVDRYMFSKIFGIPEFSSDTKLLLHVFNKNNYVPPITDLFDVFSTRASFRNVIMPPSSDAMCRYRGVIPIDRYEAGIGTDQLMTDVVSYQEVLDPCIPCYSPCAPYTCQTTCNPTEQKLLNFTLTDLSLPAKREENTTGQLVNTSISYFLTVKAVLSSGKSAEASSSVFYIDDTLPWFDLDQMTPMYIDIKQGELTPVSFQSSNSTIKAFWRCIDEESQIVENWWSIGTLVGGDDLQPWTSVGEDQIASNNSFGGILQNNKTYYVSVRCRNGAGLEATHTDKIGKS
ncbi:unnamed protein product [Mytilus edulis]|uniref:Myosin tail domain-containing protein n=1 Tax=Mytilus edulis TaxID=6550 RepID=A0A8S3U5C8_MYTED|nr:unnamed protein product [Mytilus edulis]